MTIPQTMKAAVVTELGKPLDIREHPVPQIGAGQVLITELPTTHVIALQIDMT